MNQARENYLFECRGRLKNIAFKLNELLKNNILDEKFDRCTENLDNEINHLKYLIDKETEDGNNTDYIEAIRDEIVIIKEKLSNPKPQKDECLALVDKLIDETDDLYDISSNNIRLEALSIALGELGVSEDTGHNDGARIVEYQEGFSYLKNQPWCASFVSWCYKEAAKSLNIARPFSHKASVLKLAKLAREKGWLVTGYPEPGDIFLHRNYTSISGDDHTGIVYKIENGKIYTIEGNIGNKVDIKERSLHYLETFLKVEA